MSLHIDPENRFLNTLTVIRARALSSESFVRDGSNTTRLGIVMERIGETTSIAIRDLQKNFVLPFVANPAVNDKLRENDYLSISGIHINIPYGLKTSFLTFASALETYLPLVSSTDAQLIQVEKYLLKLIGSRSSTAGTLRDRLYDQSMQRVKEIELAKNEINSCFDLNSDRGTGNYGTYFNRNSDWDIVVGKAQQINKLLKDIDLKRIIKRKDAIEEYSKDLRTELENAAGRELTAFMAEEISTILYNTATELEFLSSFVYFCNTLTETLKKNGEDLNRKLKL
jgi:hypothetical protein